MTEQERHAAKFFARLLNADLSSPTEDWDGIIEDYAKLHGVSASELQRSDLRGRLDRIPYDVTGVPQWLEAKATGKKLPPTMSKQEFDDTLKYMVEEEGLTQYANYSYKEEAYAVKEPLVLPRLRKIQKAVRLSVGGLLDPDYRRGFLQLDTQYRFFTKYDYSVYPPKSEIHWRGYDIVQHFLLPLLRHRPFPFARCPVCKQVFTHAGRGKPRKYCSESCKAKGIPSAAKRTEYQSMRRQRRRDEQLKLARRALRQARSQQEQIESLSKTFPQKSRRALVQLLNKARQRRGRKQTVKEKEG
jgi:hypothetical protein